MRYSWEKSRKGKLAENSACLSVQKITAWRTAKSSRMDSGGGGVGATSAWVGVAVGTGVAVGLGVRVTWRVVGELVAAWGRALAVGWGGALQPAISPANARPTRITL